MTDISRGAGRLTHPEDVEVMVVTVVGETSKIGFEMLFLPLPAQEKCS